MPAPEIERIVREAVLALLRHHGTLAATVRDNGVPPSKVESLLKRVDGWTGEPVDLIERVDLTERDLTLSLDLSPFQGAPLTVTHNVDVTIKRRGIEMRMVIDGPAVSSGTDPILIKAIVRASKWFDDLSNGRASTMAEIAEAEGVDERYVARIVPLAFLAPDLVEAIFDGRQPPELTADTLVKRVDLPAKWADQRALLGFT